MIPALGIQVILRVFVSVYVNEWVIVCVCVCKQESQWKSVQASYRMARCVQYTLHTSEGECAASKELPLIFGCRLFSLHFAAEKQCLENFHFQYFTHLFDSALESSEKNEKKAFLTHSLTRLLAGSFVQVSNCIISFDALLFIYSLFALIFLFYKINNEIEMNWKCRICTMHFFSFDLISFESVEIKL